MQTDILTCRILCPTALALVLSACGSVNLWPFDDSKPSAAGPRGPEGATEYRCEGNKVFHVRYLDGGKRAWVYFPDRQVALDKAGQEGGTRYSNGIAVLKFEGSDVSLTDGPVIRYTGCKGPAAGNP